MAAVLFGGSLAVGDAARLSAIYQRGTNVFAEAHFFKPQEAETNGVAFALAPLILQETGDRRPEAGGGKGGSGDGFGALVWSNGVVTPDSLRPTVYWAADTVRLDGKSRARFAFVWFYALAPSALHPEAQGRSGDEGISGEAARRGGGARGFATGRPEVRPTNLGVQGIRMVLDGAGQPVIWEVMTGDSGAELIFVSQKLEAGAAAQFGKPLAGRRYSSERSVAEAPDVVVPRVVDDGPVPLGPMVYLSAGGHAVSTLICRCMASQARKLRATTTYDLAPLGSAYGLLQSAGVSERGNGPAAFWGNGKRRVEECLRLPAGF